jgi:hypothetical protein
MAIYYFGLAWTYNELQKPDAPAFSGHLVRDLRLLPADQAKQQMASPQQSAR